MTTIRIDIDTAAPGETLITASLDIADLLERYLHSDPSLSIAECTAAAMLLATLRQGGTLESIPLAS